MLTLDHLAISARTLDEGVAFAEAALGVPFTGGGQHLHMATHNRLLGMGDTYLEVIAPDPSLPRPAWPRWFDLDRFDGPPRLTNWVARCDDLEAALAAAPAGSGVPTAFERGVFRWRMAVPADGRLPFDGAFPALIRWEGAAHPTQSLPDSGVRLTGLEITHPEGESFMAALSPLFSDPRVTIVTGPAKALRASFSTPQGPKVIG